MHRAAKRWHNEVTIVGEPRGCRADAVWDAICVVQPHDSAFFGTVDRRGNFRELSAADYRRGLHEYDRQIAARDARGVWG